MFTRVTTAIASSCSALSLAVFTTVALHENVEPVDAAIDEHGNVVMKGMDKEIWMPDHLKPTAEQE